MSIAVYPGTFNPWHKGHRDIISKAIVTFEKVIVARGTNPQKPFVQSPKDLWKEVNCPFVEVMDFDGLLKDFVKKVGATAVIRGLRNGQDFEYEKSQQYWNEDLGMDVPTLYIISDRNLTHISSSAIRAIESIKK